MAGEEVKEGDDLPTSLGYLMKDGNILIADDKFAIKNTPLIESKTL